ncbi:class II aldolase/adducin family protein [Paenibacillus validus]|uniref:Class II aldolase/adducin family protein n=1 Tax=Paenibacillus validus TaxID=44253 RepID=A0A7X2Z9U1_9BACL|nr:class II aldolase/adducin family protein [Paenibacillus validus]MUG70385.1 class II aldolase/adducin family protein [Paenibacillus validus]
MDAQVHELKLLVTKAVRMLERIELLDNNGHVSVRIPGADRFLINSRKASRASLTVHDIVMCDMEGRLVEGDSEPPSEFHIHTEIYRRRADVGSVIHNHPHYQTVLGIADIPLKPVFGVGAFVRDVPMFEDSSLINTRELGEQVAEKLGKASSVLLRHHGTVVASENVQSAFTISVFLEENAKKQYDAALLGPNMRVLEGDNLERTRSSNWQPSIIQKLWTYHQEKAEKQGALNGIEDDKEDDHR